MRMMWLAALAAAVLVRSALAAPVTFSGSVDGTIPLTGPGQVKWNVRNNGGTNDGTPTGTCTFAGGTGLTVGDAEFSPSSGDAYDSGLTVWIDDVIFVSPDTVDVTDNTLTSGPVTMSGVEVTVEYKAMQDTPTLRTRILMHNGTSEKKVFSFKLVTPFGSDATYTVVQEGNHTGEGRWRITADDATTPNDAVNTSVHGGPYNPEGSDFGPLYWPTDDETAASCSTNRGMTNAINSVRIPPGRTLELLFFNQVHATIDSAKAGVTLFNTTPAPGSALVDGFDEDALVRTLNWQFFRQVSLVGGGPGAGTRWDIWNDAGTDGGGSTADNTCDYGPGLALGDAVLDPGSDPHLDMGDAVDDAGVLFVNGQQFVDGLDGVIDGTSQYTSETVPMSGLDTRVQYTALPGSPTLRTLMTFANPGATDVTTQIVVSANFGSDSDTGFRATSSGDTNVTTADRWTVSSDKDTTPGGPGEPPRLRRPRQPGRPAGRRVLVGHLLLLRRRRAHRLGPHGARGPDPRAALLPRALPDQRAGHRGRAGLRHDAGQRQRAGRRPRRRHAGERRELGVLQQRAVDLRRRQRLHRRLLRGHGRLRPPEDPARRERAVGGLPPGRPEVQRRGLRPSPPGPATRWPRS